jgi:hypothetical protein
MGINTNLTPAQQAEADRIAAEQRAETTDKLVGMIPDWAGDDAKNWLRKFLSVDDGGWFSQAIKWVFNLLGQIMAWGNDALESFLTPSDHNAKTGMMERFNGAGDRANDPTYQARVTQFKQLDEKGFDPGTGDAIRLECEQLLRGGTGQDSIDRMVKLESLIYNRLFTQLNAKIDETDPSKIDAQIEAARLKAAAATADILGVKPGLIMLEAKSPGTLAARLKNAIDNDPTQIPQTGIAGLLLQTRHAIMVKQQDSTFEVTSVPEFHMEFTELDSAIAAPSTNQQQANNQALGVTPTTPVIPTTGPTPTPAPLAAVSGNFASGVAVGAGG